jgi:steroid 5-alpha reductase family enzyme
VFILALGTFVYILSIITTEYSWIDRVWSLLPILFQGHILFYQSACDMLPITVRQWIMIGLTTLWGLRLTYNFWRKGGYKKGGEDYRWAYIRKNYPRVLVELLNFIFTAYYQVFLIYWFSAPIKYAYKGQDLTLTDFACIALWLLVWLG